MESEVPWIMIGFRIPYDYIDPELKEGDVDIFFARLTPNFDSPFQSKIDWSYLVGLEIKAAYYNNEDKLKSAGLVSKHEGVQRIANKQKGARKQANRIFECGFDQIGLLHIISTEPREESSRGIQSWFLADEARNKSEQEVIPLIHTESNDPFGTLLLTIGAVPDKLEDESGVWGRIKVIKEMKTHSEQPIDFKQKLQNETEKTILKYSEKVSWPILMLACSDRGCRTLYVTTVHSLENCPVCGARSC